MKLNDVLRKLASSGPEQVAGFALAAFLVISAAVTVTAIVESYANLVTFGLDHGMVTWHGAIAPVAVDAFIVMGELMLILGILRHWDGKGYYAVAGGMVAGGFAMSVGGNVLRTTALPVWADRAVQAIWPITATAALTGCLIIIKRLMTSRAAGKTAVPVRAAKTLPSASSSRKREFRTGAVPGREARATELTAASDHENSVVQSLVTAGKPLPSIRKLAAAEFDGKIRPSQRVLKLAAARMNGTGHGDPG